MIVVFISTNKNGSAIIALNLKFECIMSVLCIKMQHGINKAVIVKHFAQFAAPGASKHMLVEQSAPAIAPDAAQLYGHAQVLRVFSERVQRQLLAGRQLAWAEDALVEDTPRVSHVIFAICLKVERHLAVLAHFESVQAAHLTDVLGQAEGVFKRLVAVQTVESIVQVLLQVVQKKFLDSSKKIGTSQFASEVVEMHVTVQSSFSLKKYICAVLALVLGPVFMFVHRQLTFAAEVFALGAPDVHYHV
jgi:hypothetical protein